MEKIRKRILSVQSDHPENAPVTEDKLRRIKGIESADLDTSTGTLTIVYNITHVHLRIIVTILRGAGWIVEPGFPRSMKLRWRCLMEENEQSNLTAPVHPCCELPTAPNRDGTHHH